MSTNDHTCPRPAPHHVSAFLLPTFALCLCCAWLWPWPGCHLAIGIFKYMCLLGPVVAGLAYVALPALAARLRPYQGGYHELDHALLNFPGDTAWMNLGFWKHTESYPEACEALARMLGQAVQLSSLAASSSSSHRRAVEQLSSSSSSTSSPPKSLSSSLASSSPATSSSSASSLPSPASTLLDVGFGCGQQLEFWQSEFGVRALFGINISPAEVAIAGTRVNPNLFTDLRTGSATALPFPDASFAAVVSLDSAYHYDARLDFFREAFRVLLPNGRLGTADIILSDKAAAQCLTSSSASGGARRKQHTHNSSYLSRFALSLVCWLSGVPQVNMVSLDEYQAQLVRVGFTSSSIVVQDVSAHVFSGFASFVPRHLAAVKSGWFASGYYRMCGVALGALARRDLLRFVVVNVTKPN